jgi:hypothetical protein
MLQASAAIVLTLLPMHEDYLSNNPEGDPFVDDTPQSRPRSSTSWSLITVGIVAAGGLLMIALCCGGGWFAFRFGMGLVAEEVQAELDNYAVIQEHIGAIQTLSMDITKSAAVEGDGVLVFRIEGDKGSGYVTVESVTNAAGTEEVTGGSLQLDTGETFPLLPFGMDVLTEEVRGELDDNAVVQEHIGAIQTMSIDHEKSAAVEGDDVFVFRIEGDKGSGYVTVESVTNAAGMEEVAGGSLRLDTGETFPLLPADSGPAEGAPEAGDE